MRLSLFLLLTYLYDLNRTGRAFAHHYTILYTVLDQYQNCIGQVTQFFYGTRVSDSTLAQLTAALTPIMSPRNITLSNNFTTEFCPPFDLLDGISVKLCTEDGYASFNGYLDFYFLRNAFDNDQLVQLFTNITAPFCVREYSVRENIFFSLLMVGLVGCCLLDYLAQSRRNAPSPMRYEVLDRQTLPSLFPQPKAALSPPNVPGNCPEAACSATHSEASQIPESSSQLELSTNVKPSAIK